MAAAAAAAVDEFRFIINIIVLRISPLPLSRALS